MHERTKAILQAAGEAQQAIGMLTYAIGKGWPAECYEEDALKAQNFSALLTRMVHAQVLDEQETPEQLEARRVRERERDDYRHGERMNVSREAAE